VKFTDGYWMMRPGVQASYPALVLAPAPHVLSAADAEHLARYGADGGCLVAGYLTGTVDETTRLHPGGYQADALREALGVFVEELKDGRAAVTTRRPSRSPSSSPSLPSPIPPDSNCPAMAPCSATFPGDSPQ